MNAEFKQAIRNCPDQATLAEAAEYFWKAAQAAQKRKDAEIVTVLQEVQDLVNIIFNSDPSTTIKEQIESAAFSLGHHPFVLNPKAIEEQED